MSERRVVSYSAEMRANAKKQNLPLVTVDTPEFTGQLIGDKQLCSELLKVFMEGRKRQLERRSQTSQPNEATQ